MEKTLLNLPAQNMTALKRLEGFSFFLFSFSKAALYEILDVLESKSTAEEELFWIRTQAVSMMDFLKLILQLNDCLSPRLDADMLSVTERGDGGLCFLADFLFLLWFFNNRGLNLQCDPIYRVANYTS